MSKTKKGSRMDADEAILNESIMELKAIKVMMPRMVFIILPSIIAVVMQPLCKL